MRTCTKCNGKYADEVVSCVADGEPLPDPDVEPGTTINEYKVEGRLGAGAFGSVYRAVHPLIGKKVAIKVLNRQFSANPEMVSRFISEARAVNQIGHKNIIDIFAFGQLPDGRQFYVMELLKGVTLEKYVRERGRLMMQEAVPILRGVARALDAAHKAGIAHRDLKPENVLVADDDGRAFPKLLDFGIAKLTTSDGAMHRTRTGTPMGTPYYMSPEQCRGRDVDHRTDIYSFGVMTYAVLTGYLPFVGEDFLEIITQQVKEEPVPPSQRHEDIPEAVDEVVAWMMKKDPSARPRTLADAITALEQAATAEGVATHSGVTTLTADQRRQLSSNFGMTRGGATGSRSSVPVMKTMIGTGTEPPVGSNPPADTRPPGKVATQPPPGGTGGTSPPHLAQSMIAAEMQVPPTKARRTGLVIGVVAGVVAVAALMIVVASRGNDGAGEAPPRPSSPTTAAAPVAPSVPASPGAGVEVPATASAPPPATNVTPATVVVRIDGTAGATVLDGSDKPLGIVPMSLTTPRGDVAIELRVTKAGFAPDVEHVVPSSDHTLSVQLHELPHRTNPPPATPPATTTIPPKPPETKPPDKKKSGLPDF